MKLFVDAGMNIRRATLQDIDAITRIENESFPDPWSREAFIRDIISSEYAYLAVLGIGGINSGTIVGYVDMTCILDEANIDSIAVLPAYRGRGYGDALLVHAIEIAVDRKCKLLMLEVRRSNEKAISMYTKYGFTEVGVRKNYYEDNGEDAILMNLKLKD